MNALHPIAGNDDRNRLADIIFVPSLDPYSRNPRKIAFETWGEDYSTRAFWPYWLHRDLKLRENGLLHTAIWLLEYNSADAGGQQTALNLENRAANIFAQLRRQDVGEKPIIFVCHSLGGLMVKMLLEQGFTNAVKRGRAIVEQVCGVVFLATPHYGVTLTTVTARLRHFLRKTPALLELALDAKRAHSLANWYCNNVTERGIQTLSFHETLPSDTVLVVKTNAADPTIAVRESYPVACDHSAIAKLTSRDNEVYTRTLRFARELLSAMNPTVPVILPTVDEVMPAINHYV